MLRDLVAFPPSCSLLETHSHSLKSPLFCYLLFKMVTVTARRLRGTHLSCEVTMKLTARTLQCCFSSSHVSSTE